MKNSKTTFIVIATSITLFNYALSQTQELAFETDTDPENIDAIMIGETGFVLKTVEKKKRYNLRFFTPDLTKLWDVFIESSDKLSSDMQNTDIIATPSADYIYFIEDIIKLGLGINSGTPGKKSLVQIDKNGNTKTLSIDLQSQYKNLQHIFTDDNYLYLLTTLKGNEQKENEKAFEEKLILHRFTHEDFSHNNYILDLPQIKDAKLSTFWHFLDNTGDEIFLYSEYHNDKIPAINCRIISINNQGEILDNIEIEKTYSNKQIDFIPTLNRKFVYTASQAINNDFSPPVYKISPLGIKSAGQTPVRTSGTGQTQYQSLQYKPLNGAMGDVSINKNDKSIYLFGIYREKADGKTPVQFYIYKYNFDGELIWEQDNEVQTTLGIHNILFEQTADNNIKAQFFHGTVFTYIISKDGEMANQYKNKAPMFGIYFPNSLSVMYDSKNPSEVNKYHKSKVLTQKNIQYHRIINFANNDVLIYLKKNEPVKLLSFEK